MPVKRKVRAKSSKDSTPSPDDKRTRKEFDSVSSQTDDEVNEALNMAEDLGKKIEHVLSVKTGKAGRYRKPSTRNEFDPGKYRTDRKPLRRGS